MQVPRTTNKYFDVLINSEQDVDALEDWLTSVSVVTSSDAITWWTGMESAGHPLACMSLDFLTIPGELLKFHLVLFFRNLYSDSNFNRC
jgi:hypothetical protein